MTDLDADQTLDLVTRLRELGCTSVELPGFKATFSPALKLVDVPARPPKTITPPTDPTEPENANNVEDRRKQRAEMLERLNG